MERELKETLVYFGEAGFFRSSSTTSEATIKPEDLFSLVASFSSSLQVSVECRSL